MNIYVQSPSIDSSNLDLRRKIVDEGDLFCRAELGGKM